jgi:hypothetical protein
VDLAIGEHAVRKSRACNAYRSQLPMFDSAMLSDLSAPERYWQWTYGGTEATPSARPARVAAPLP